MPIQIVRNDITKMAVDAIVNAANSSLLGGGGVDGCIHRAAGPGLLAECETLGGCETGSAKVTRAYQLPCKYVIHAVGPIWRGGTCGERELLASCYGTSLRLAQARGCGTVAFPLISSGVYGYPKAEALRVAVDAISAFLAGSDADMTVYVVIFDRASYQIGEQLFADIAAYIDDHYVDSHTDPRREQNRRACLESAQLPLPMPTARPTTSAPAARREKKSLWRGKKPAAPPAAAAAMPIAAAASLEEAVSMLDESFSQMLLRKIDERGMTDAQCYKKANIDRKLFSKIRGDKQYKPSKPTVLAFAIALELSLAETKDMLMKAGFALSRSSKFDVIVEYFIQRGNYNVFEINEALFAFDQSLLGA